MEKLRIKNFGAIKDIEIDLQKLTIFIGKSGTGKSTVASLITIFRNIEFWNNLNFEEWLKYHQIYDFLRKASFIKYQSDYLSITYQKGQLGKIIFGEKIIKNVSISNTGDIAKESIFSFQQVINQSITIPAERLLAIRISESYAEIDRKSDLIDFLPPTLLDFVAEFNQISKLFKSFHISLFDVTYEKGKNNENYINLPDKTQLLLNISASGMQTIIPTLLILQHYSNDDFPKSFTLEEPELNLFPDAQKELVEFLVEKVINNNHQLVLCTHSPYILTSLNNLLYAHQIQKEFPESKEQVLEIIDEYKLIKSEDVAVYYLHSPEEFEDYDTFAVDLIDKDTGLIDGNELDSASEYINETSNILFNLYREHKRANRNYV